MIGLPEILAGVAALALGAYALSGGADFGGGVWDLFATGPRRDAQRRLVARAIAPIWEANHVWLILVVVLLFTCFPPAFAALSTALHVPLTLALVGIVLRGSAFVFRAYGGQNSVVQDRWGRVFAVASIVTPVLLGICVGAVASGDAGRAAADAAAGRGTFASVYLAPWLSPLSVATGVLALLLFAFLAAVYLTVDATGDAELQEDFRRRALLTLGASGIGAAVVLMLARAHGDAIVGERLTASAWAPALHAAAALSAVVALLALLRRRYLVARVASASLAALVVLGWAAAQFPWIVPPTLSIRDAAAPESTLRAVSWTLGIGTAVLAPSLLYLFRVFKRVPGRGAPRSVNG